MNTLQFVCSQIICSALGVLHAASENEHLRASKRSDDLSSNEQQSFAAIAHAIAELSFYFPLLIRLVKPDLAQALSRDALLGELKVMEGWPPEKRLPLNLQEIVTLCQPIGALANQVQIFGANSASKGAQKTFFSVLCEKYYRLMLIAIGMAAYKLIPFPMHSDETIIAKKAALSQIVRDSGKHIDPDVLAFLNS